LLLDNGKVGQGSKSHHAKIMHMGVGLMSPHAFPLR
jgi:hypothetical protein